MNYFKTTFASLIFLQAAVSAEVTKSNPCEPKYYSSWFPLEGDFTLAFDDFRSLPDGSWEGNMGAFTSLNFKAEIPLSIFIHFGGSYGLYDWAGRGSTPNKSSTGLQQQAFLTGAISRETPCSSGINGGIAYDGMLNENFGLFATSPYLSQVRGQAGYLIKGGNELGLWATVYTNTSHKESTQIPLRFRAISQINLFWCHYFKNYAYGMVWVGMPYLKGLMYSSGLPGTYILGARFSAPLTSYLSINGHAAYMGARHAPHQNAFRNYGANICFGLTYAFGQRKKQRTPYMSLADNSNFIADTNQNQ